MPSTWSAFSKPSPADKGHLFSQEALTDRPLI